MRNYRESSIGNIPPRAVTSRFVAPWDTSGWYYMDTGLCVGSKLYSNADVRVASLPEKYVGADFVVTFNSKADGFDDKQELDFYAERDVEVFVALDSALIPEFTAEFNDTSDIMSSTDGVEYKIFSKKYEKGAHINIPGFKGEANHFSCFIIADDYADTEAPLPETAVAAVPAAYVSRTYKSYINDVFNGDSISADYKTTGEVKILRRESEVRDGYLSLSAGASVMREFDGSDRVVGAAKINIKEGSEAIFALGGVSVAFEGGKITANGESFCELEYGKDISLRIVYNGEAGEAEIFINCLKRATVKAEKCKVQVVAFAVIEGEAALDNLTVADDTEIFVVNEDFASVDEAYTAKSENADISCVKYPYESSHAIGITSKDGKDASFTYGFAPVSGKVSVESLLIASSDEFCYAPALADKNGNIAVKIALYANNLYASDGDKFVRIFGGLCDFMYFPCENAMNIKVTVDTESGTYDLMVDGAYRAKGYKLACPVKEISNAVYSAGKGGLTLMRIRVYDDADLCRNVIPQGPVFDVTKAPYNAVGDGKTLDTPAIQKAINDAAFTGGTVYIPDGVYFSGEIFLASDMTFFVSRGATILGTHDHGEYPLMEPGTSLCAVRQLGRALVYGENLSNIRVTGGGMLDGNGTYRFKMNDPLSDRRVADARPDLIYITYSKDIMLESINFKSPGFWTVVPLSSENIIMRYLNLDCLNTPNRDGIDPVDCKSMTIYSCNIMAGDDGLCFKSSDPFGCADIVVYDMMIQSLASGIKFGTDTYFSLKNLRVSDCFVKNVNRCGISLESVDGADVEDLIFERISMTDVGAPVYITVGDRKRCPRGGAPARLGYIKNVLFDELRFEKAYPFAHSKWIREVMAIGQYPNAGIEDVTFRNCDFTLAGGATELFGEPKTIDNRYPEYDRHGPSAGHAFTVKYAKNFKVENCKITLEKEDVRPQIAYFDYEA